MNSSMTQRRAAFAAGVVAIAVLATAPGADAASPHCLHHGDKVLAKSRRAVVFARSARYGHGSSAYDATTAFGCWRPSGRKVRLGIDDDNYGEYVHVVHIARRLAAFAAVSCDGTGSSCSADVQVWNLKRRKRTRKADALDDPSSSNLYDVRSLVVKGDGAVAWIARDEDASPNQYEVHKIDADGPATLARGSDVNGGSLRRHGSDLTWKQGGSVQHSTLR